MCGSNVAVGLHLDEPLARQQVGERAVDEPDAVGDLRLAVLDRGLDRPLEVVDIGSSCFTSRSRGPRHELLLLARNALAVVVELGLQPLERVEVLVALR